MSKVTDQYQVTLPKALARHYGIRPGDEVSFEAAGEAIRLVPAHKGASAAGLDNRGAPAPVRRSDRPPAGARGGQGDPPRGFAWLDP